MSLTAASSRSCACFHASALPPRACRPRTASLRCRASAQQQQQQLEDAGMLVFKASMLPLPALRPSTSSDVQPASCASSSSTALPLMACALLASAALASTFAPPSMAQELHAASSLATPPASPSQLFDLAEGGEEFWPNVVRYGRYFVTVMLGTGYVMLRPLANMFKNPVSAILAIALLVGGVVGTKATLEAMLGLQSVDFQIAGDY